MLRRKINFFYMILCMMILLISLPIAGYSFNSKSKTWIKNGKEHMKKREYREAVYSFYMANFYEKDNKELETLLKEASEKLKRNGPSIYLIPREPFKFSYIMFKEKDEQIENVNIGRGSTIFKDGSSINLSTYLKKVENTKKRRHGYWGDKKRVLSSGVTNKKIIALTYDDGPSSRYTPKLMKILKKYNVKATFFVIGKNVKNNKKLLKKMYDAGHLIGNHSWSHKNMARLGNNSLDKELDKTDKIIEEAGVKLSPFFRPPYGAISKRLIKKIKSKNKYIVLWSIDTRDWQKPSASTILKRIFNTVRPGDVILMHDIHPQALYVTESIIKVMKKAGYRFVLLDELYNIKMNNNSNKVNPQSNNISKKENDKLAQFDMIPEMDMVIDSKMLENINMGVINNEN